MPILKFIMTILLHLSQATMAIDILIRIINAHIDAIQKDAKQSDREVGFDSYTFSP